MVIPDTHAIVELLTMASLTGLLFASGLRLTPAELLASLADRARLARVLAVNFVLVPALGLALATAAGLSRDRAVGILLLAAAPFAPVVPIFTRMALGDLALAASLTALLPVFSSFLTPWVSALGLGLLSGPGELRFDVRTILLVLLATITLPLVVGVGVRRRSLRVAVRLLGPGRDRRGGGRGHLAGVRLRGRVAEHRDDRLAVAAGDGSSVRARPRLRLRRRRPLGAGQAGDRPRHQQSQHGARDPDRSAELSGHAGGRGRRGERPALDRPRALAHGVVALAADARRLSLEARQRGSP